MTWFIVHHHPCATTPRIALHRSWLFDSTHSFKILLGDLVHQPIRTKSYRGLAQNVMPVAADLLVQDLRRRGFAMGSSCVRMSKHGITCNNSYEAFGTFSCPANARRTTPAFSQLTPVGNSSRSPVYPVHVWRDRKESDIEAAEVAKFNSCKIGVESKRM